VDRSAIIKCIRKSVSRSILELVKLHEYNFACDEQTRSSVRYQSQFDCLSSIESLGLSKHNLFRANNALSVGAPETSSDGSKARFVGGKWRNQIRAQRRLTSDVVKIFPPIVIGDSVRDIQFAVDVGGVLFGVSETGEDSKETLLSEIQRQGNDLSTRSRVFSSLADDSLINE
jgi:hypothetical protein